MSDTAEMRATLAELGALARGWLDGGGEALPPFGVAWLSDVLAAAMDEHRMPRPYLYPTEEGGVQAEWSIGLHLMVSARFDLSARSVFMHSLDLRADAVVEAEHVLDGMEDADAAETVATFVLARLFDAGQPPVLAA